MIASFANGFVFLKTRKTAGTTTEIALTPSCGPDDILTLITPEDERLRLQDGKVAARNYVGDRELEAAIAAALLAEDEGQYRALRRRANRLGAFQNHVIAAELKERLPAEFWDSAFKFTIERHPYEKVVSRAYWSAGKYGLPSMPEVIDRVVEDFTDDTPIYSIDGELVVDEILRQENLAEDIGRIAARLGLELPAALPRAKGRFRSDRRPATEILSDRQKAMIYERTAKVFELMDYRR